MKIAREMTFTESEVEQWCEQSGDSNPLHLDQDFAEDSLFGERVVPGVMVLDRLSGMLTEHSPVGQIPILAGITAVKFRDPVFFGEEVEMIVEERDNDALYTYLDFEVNSPERNTLLAHGTFNVTYLD